jgi:hypothetical protein
VCRAHGGALPQVRAAAERRWERERVSRAIERELEKATGKPPDDFTRALIRYGASADPATLRKHRRTREAD